MTCAVKALQERLRHENKGASFEGQFVQCRSWKENESGTRDFSAVATPREDRDRSGDCDSALCGDHHIQKTDGILKMYGNNFRGRMPSNAQPKFKAPQVLKIKRADVAGIVEEDFGKYQIKAGRLSGAYVARAFPKPPAQAQGTIAEAKGDSANAAITALKALIEARDVERTQNRRWEERSSISVPNEAEYLEALRQVNLSQTQVAMLKAQAIAAEDGLTFGQLANTAGFKSRDTAAKVLKKAGVLIADYLRIEVTDDDTADSDGAVKVLAFGRVSEKADSPTAWIMHEELRKAVRSAL